MNKPWRNLSTELNLFTCLAKPRYGGERYEKRDLQIRVRQRFAELQKMDEKQGQVPWHIIDASKTVEEVTVDIVSIVDATIKRVQEGKPLAKMWDEGDFVLPTVGSSGADAGDAKAES